MIFVRRDDSNRPSGFDELRAQMEQGLVQARESDSSLSIGLYWSRVRSRLGAVAAALDSVFSGKCAFCEARPAHVSHPHIEHYRPKARFEDLTFVWENWLLSCGRCNQSKWAHFPIIGGQPVLLDPTSDDPRVHIDFERARVVGLTDRGRETIRLVRLDRSPLEDERARWLLQIDALLLLVIGSDEVAAREAREILIWSMQAEAPYAAMTRVYLESRVPRLAKPPEPHPRIEMDAPRRRIEHLLHTRSSTLLEMF